MNYQKLTGFILPAILFSVIVTAQTPVKVNEPDLSRPKLFKELPAEVAVPVGELERLVTVNPAGEKKVSLRSSPTSLPVFKGQIVSRVDKYANTMHSVVIRLDEFDGATLTLSSSTHPDGTVTYTGRIISFKHGDVYELQKKNDQYILVRRDYYELVNE